MSRWLACSWRSGWKASHLIDQHRTPNGESWEEAGDDWHLVVKG